MRIMGNWLTMRVMLAFFCTTLSVFSQETVEEWQKKAVTDFPELGQSGSLLNLKFVQMVNSLRISNPSFFKDPKWPYTLALQIGGVKPSQPNVIPGLESVPNNPVAGTAPSKANEEDSLDAQKLASDFKTDQQAANARYVGKRLSVTGKIIRITPSGNPVNVAFVYLESGAGLPCVKVELNKMKKYLGKTSGGYSYTDKNGFELRVTNNSTLEVRSHETHSTSSYYYYRHSSVQNGDWTPVLTNGEQIKVLGTCGGKKLDIILGNADLQKDDLP